MRYIKQLLLIATLFIASISLNAQSVGFNIGVFKPNLKYSQTFKTSPSFSLIYGNEDISSRFRISYEAGIRNMRRTQDTINYLEISGNHAYPSRMIFNSFYVIPITLNLDVKILEGDFSPFIGISTGIELAFVEMSEGMFFSIYEGNWGTSFGYNLGVRIGAAYNYGEYLEFFGCLGYEGTLDLDMGFYPITQMNVGLRYFLDL